MAGFVGNNTASMPNNTVTPSRNRCKLIAARRPSAEATPSGNKAATIASSPSSPSTAAAVSSPPDPVTPPMIEITTIGDVPAGTGTMFVDDGIAWFDWGATAPEARRRGSQSAIMRRRVLDALELGVERMFTCTGEEVPGDPQHSYSNILRAGFKERYVRENYAVPKPQA